MATITDVGMNYKQKLFGGLVTVPCKFFGLDGDTSGEVTTANSPNTELITNGALRKEAVVTDETSGSDFAIKFEQTWEFSGPLTIGAFFLAWSQSSGPNMYMRHKLSSAQPVDNEDIFTAVYVDHLTRPVT